MSAIGILFDIDELADGVESVTSRRIFIAPVFSAHWLLSNPTPRLPLTQAAGTLLAKLATKQGRRKSGHQYNRKGERVCQRFFG